jgi:glycosyltransferase involved in cell wall biosynthesis
MRVAIVHDWLYVLGGAERVLREMLRCYPQADVFALFDVLSRQERSWIGFERSRTSFMQRIPGIAGMHRNLLPFMPYAIEQFDLSGYGLVISSSYAVAKGVITGPDQVHITYVHSPMRYAWDLQHLYLRESSGLLGVKGALARMMLHRIRLWDAISSLRPNALIANSAYIARRIRKVFGRQAYVIHPPVDTIAQAAGLPRKKHFLAAGRLVAYKNVQAVVEAFKLVPDLELIVAGSGPAADSLRLIAGPNVTFTGFVTDGEMRRLMATAQAIIYPAEEDFGIIPVEAQVEGTPVLALGRGGVRESVVADGPRRTGMFFDEAVPHKIAACVNAFLATQSSFSCENCQIQAARFSAARFRTQFKTFVDNEVEKLSCEIEASFATSRAAPALVAGGSL